MGTPVWTVHCHQKRDCGNFTPGCVAFRWKSDDGMDGPPSDKTEKQATRPAWICWVIFNHLSRWRENACPDIINRQLIRKGF